MDNNSNICVGCCLFSWGGEGPCLDLNSWCKPVSDDDCVLGKCKVGPRKVRWRGENHSLAIQIPTLLIWLCVITRP